VVTPTTRPVSDVDGEEASYAAQPAVFDRCEIQQLMSEARARRWSPAEVSRPGEIDAGYRSAQLSWLHPREAGWVFERLATVVAEINPRVFGFDLAGFHDPLQLTRYDASSRGHYDWHTDRGTLVNGRPSRKLTVVVQLTPGSEYDGGDLEFLIGREPLRAARESGTVAVFPSFVLHRVTPVTRGSRLSLVGWVVGPKFR
jgi:PKHD-type hydroxylase